MRVGIRLRDYQTECLDRLIPPLLAGEANRLGIVVPTGGGKTVIAGGAFARLLDAGVRRPMFVSHRDEINRQAASTIATMLPASTSIGIVQGERDDVRADVLVGSIQTLASRTRLDRVQRAGTIGALCIDECHHATAATYVDVMTTLGSYGRTPTWGVTATMQRADGAHLGDVWTNVVFRRDIRWMIANGYLCDVRGLTVNVPDFDPDEPRGSRDYTDTAIGDALVDSSAPELVVKAWREHASDRPTILFAPTVASAEMFTDAFIDAGITAELVTGATPSEERQAIYRRVRSGQTMILCNCMVLTEGFDLPPLSCAIIARPTKSQGLYIQMGGRVLRTSPGKTDALIIDLAGVAATHSLCGIVDLSESKKPDGAQVEDGETLAQAAERWDDELDLDDYDDGIVRPERLQLRPVDLFAAAHAAWLETARHNWILSGKGFTVCVFTRDGLDGYGVGVMQDRGGWETLQGGIDLELAMAVGEMYADDHTEGWGTTRSAPWRKRRATDRATAYARGLGLDVPDGARGGEVADLITLHKAAQRGL